MSEYGSNTQIIALYDSNTDLTVDAIAAAFGKEVEAIKMVLLAGSVRYQSEVRQNPDLFTSEDELIARDTIKRLCHSEIDGVALKAATTLIDERKGRRNVKHQAKAVGSININVFNNYLQKGRERLKEIKGEAIAA
jgi:hypothetical protein